MGKIVALALLLVLYDAAAEAEIYRCRSIDGTLVLTDDPTRLPPGCRPERAGGGQGSLSIVPAQSPKAAGSVETTEKRTKRVESATGADRVESWKEEARQLARDYRETVSQRYRTMAVSQKRQILKRIGELKSRRDELRRAVLQARLPRNDLAEIEAALASVPP